jgi:hypothetical protein
MKKRSLLNSITKRLQLRNQVLNDKVSNSLTTFKLNGYDAFEMSRTSSLQKQPTFLIAFELQGLNEHRISHFSTQLVVFFSIIHDNATAAYVSVLQTTSCKLLLLECKGM